MTDIEKSSICEHIKTRYELGGLDYLENVHEWFITQEMRDYARAYVQEFISSLNQDQFGNNPCDWGTLGNAVEIEMNNCLNPGRGGFRLGSGRKPSADTEKRKSFSVSIPDSLCHKIQNFCSSHGCSVNQYIIDSVKMRLNK